MLRLLVITTNYHTFHQHKLRTKNDFIRIDFNFNLNDRSLRITEAFHITLLNL